MIRAWHVIMDVHDHASQRCWSTFACCYARFAGSTRTSQQRYFQGQKCLLSIFGSSFYPFYKKPSPCPLRAWTWETFYEVFFVIWTQLVIISRERRVLRSPITCVLTHFIVSLISRRMRQCRCGSNVFPLTLGQIFFYNIVLIAEGSTFTTSQTLQAHRAGVSGIHLEMGSAMRTRNETPDLLTVTHQNGFRSTIHSACQP